MNFRKLVLVSLVGLGLIVASALPAFAQSVSVPTLFRMTGTLTFPDGTPRSGAVVMIASLYRASDDPTPLWTEQQSVELAAGGRYTLQVGATLPDGVPKEYFVNGDARWLGVALIGETDQPRVMLVNVPYALKAFEAEQLSGKKISDFVLNSTLDSSIKTAMSSLPTITSNISTASFIPKYVDSGGTLTNSVLYENSGQIGVNTTTPSDAMDVRGIFRISATGGSPNYARFDNTNNPGGKIWRFGSTGATSHSNFDIYNQTNDTLSLTITGNGLVGIGGVTSPLDALDIKGIVRMSGTSGSPNYLRFDNTINPGGKIWRFGNTGAGTLGTFDIYNQSDNVVGLSVSATGNVGVGTVTPTAKLDVVGSINVSGNINAKYQDVAEWVETPTKLADGTVVIVDPKSPNRVIASAKAYDTRVAGAVSRQPGMILGEGSDSKAMIAANGRVLIKVDARYGAIKIGDLLVTSPTPGYAMKSKPVTVGGVTFHRTGTILGKALQAMPHGKGEILVLLMLQ